MPRLRKYSAAFWLIAIAGWAGGFGAAAQPYPAKPIRLVVPLAPGGGVDLISRLVGQKMGDSMRQSVIVDNRPGASTMIGTEIVARSPPMAIRW